MAPNNLSMFLESDFTLLVCSFLFLFATLSAVWTPEMSDTHRSIHHVRFAVPQGLYCVEDINHTLSLGHLTDNAAGAEYSATPAAISVKGQRQKILARHWTKTSSGLCFMSHSVHRYLSSTHRQCTMVLPSPSSPSRCHWSTCRISLRKERLEAGTSLCPAQPRYWNCRTIR